MIYICDVYAYYKNIVHIIHDTEKKLIKAGAKITDVRITSYNTNTFNEYEMAAYIYYEAEKEIEL